MANRVLSHLTGLAMKESSGDLEADILFTKKKVEHH